MSVADACRVGTSEFLANPATVRIVDPRQIPDWNQKIEELPGSSVFHTTNWCSVLCETYGYEPCWLVALSGERLDAVLPLIEVRSWLTGTRGVSLPFTDECCALGSPQAVERLLHEARALGERKGWKYLQIRSNPINPAESSISYYQHNLSLGSSIESIFSGFAPSVRRAIRKAEAAGVTVEQSSNLEGMRAYYHLHCLTRRRHGLPPQPFAFFAEIYENLVKKGNGFVVLASAARRVVSGAVFLMRGGKAHYKFGASDISVQGLRPNNLGMWRAIQSLRERGLLGLDFGRTSLNNEGLRRFKLGWGAEESLLSYSKWDCKSSRPVKEFDGSAGWQNVFFRHSPMILSRLAGAALYRHAA